MAYVGWPASPGRTGGGVATLHWDLRGHRYPPAGDLTSSGANDNRGEMQVPRHIAIIMDGNGRWARARGKRRLEGHRAGLKAIRQVLRACDELGVSVLSLYAFSTENWTRPRTEVDGLMRLFSQTLDREIDELNSEGVQLRITGRRDGLSPRLLRKIEAAEALTRPNQGRVLNLLINYGGRAEIVDAVKTLLASGLDPGGLTDQDISNAPYHPH